MSSSEERQPLVGKIEKEKTAYGTKPRIELDIENVYLKKQITFIHVIGILVGNVIGSGIFITPKGVTENVGSVGATLVLWSIIGVYVLAQSLCYAELGTVIPKAGGDYFHVHVLMGAIPGFLCMWIQVVVAATSSIAAIARTASIYIMTGLTLECHTSIIYLTTILIIVATGTLNIISVKWAARVITTFSVCKVLALFVIIITGMVFLFQGGTQNFENAFEGTNTDPGLLAAAMLEGYFAFKGWETVTTLPEEMVNPGRDLPLAMLVGILLISGIYVLTNVAYFAVLTPAELIQSDAVAMTFAERALAGGAWIMPIFVALSCIGSCTSNLMTDPKYMFAAGRFGQAPAMFSMLHIRFYTAVLAIAAIMLISVFYSFIPQIQQLVELASLGVQLKILLALLSLLYFRWKRPDIHRPVKVNIVVVVLTIIILLALVGLCMYQDPMTGGIGIGIFLLGVPVYFLGKLFTRKTCVNIMDRITMNMQQMFLIAGERSDDQGSLDEYKNILDNKNV